MAVRVPLSVKGALAARYFVDSEPRGRTSSPARPIEGMVSRASVEAEDAPTTDYLRTISTVSWPRRSNLAQTDRITVDGIANVPHAAAGGVGNLLVQLQNGASQPLSGAGVSVSTSPTRSANTGTNGCVLWRDVPVGSPTVTVQTP